MTTQSVFYVLFSANTHALMLEEHLRKAGIRARISPTPHDLQGLAGCGVALLIEEKDIAAARGCIEAADIPYVDIVRRDSPFNPRRDRFC